MLLGRSSENRGGMGSDSGIVSEAVPGLWPGSGLRRGGYTPRSLGEVVEMFEVRWGGASRVVGPSGILPFLEGVDPRDCPD